MNTTINPKNPPKEWEIIEQLPNEKIEEIEELPVSHQKNVENLVSAISAAGLEEFMEYIQSPWKMIWPNFIAGVSRGIGTLVGAALVIALIGWFLSQIITLPLIGARMEPYVKSLQDEINKYTEATNYKQNFIEMQKTLEEIRTELKQPIPR